MKYFNNLYKLFVTLSLVIFAVTNACSQTISSYVWHQEVRTFTPILGMGGETLVSASVDDGDFGPFPIGFTFTYHGTPFTQFGIDANGVITLGTVPANLWTASPVRYMFGTLLTDAIAGMSMDLLTDTNWTGSGAGIRYITTGIPGSRILTVEWLHERPFMGFVHSGNDEGNFQIKLYEANGEIDVAFGNFVADYFVSWGANCQVGLIGTTFSDFNIRTTLEGIAHQSPDYGNFDPTPWDSTIAATASNNQKSYYHGNLPMQPLGLTYIWIPPIGTPKAIFTGGGGICAGDSISFADQSTNAPVSWQWSFPGGSPASSSSQHPQKIQYSTAGTYDVTLVVSNSFGSDTLLLTNYVNVYAIPTISVSPVAPMLCKGSSVTLTGSGGNTYSWSPSSGLSATTGSSVDAKPDSTTSYKVIGTDNHGCSNTSNVTVTVDPLPQISMGPDQTICAKDSIQLNVTGAPSGSTYTWTPVTGLNCTTCLNPKTSLTAPATYVVVATDPSGCSGADTLSINVTTVNAFVSNDTAVCYGNFVQLHATGGTSYSWSPTTGLINPTTADPIAIDTMTNSYIVTATTAGCNSTATVTVTVKPSPPTPVIAPINDTLYCSKDPSYVSYQWYGDSVLVPGATKYYYVITKSGNYNVQVTNGDGCSIAVGINIVLGVPQYIPPLPFTINPNPAHDQLFIRMDAKATLSSAKIVIYNELGEVCYQSGIRNSKTEIDIAAFSKGIYLIKIESESGRWIERFIKE